MSLVVIVVAPTEAMIQTIIVLKATDYGKALDSIGPETFSYIDPPYPPLNDTAYFTHYTALRFGSSEELRVDRNASSGDIVLQALIAVDRGHIEKPYAVGPLKVLNSKLAQFFETGSRE